MKYKFTHKGKNETINMVDADSKHEAEEFFAKNKKLALRDFLAIYEVKKVEDKVDLGARYIA